MKKIDYQKEFQMKKRGTSIIFSEDYYKVVNKKGWVFAIGESSEKAWKQAYLSRDKNLEFLNMLYGETPEAKEQLKNTLEVYHAENS